MPWEVRHVLGNRTDLEDAEAYLDLLEASVSGVDLKDEEKFRGDVARLFARPDVEAPTNVEGKAGLQLLTIHKAKGLEFDTVILPGLGTLHSVRGAKLDDVARVYRSSGETRLLLAPIQETAASRIRSMFTCGRFRQ